MYAEGLPFFLPSRLIDFEYFEGKPDPEYDDLAKDYVNEIDFAFFVVNFGYTRADYDALTPKEKTFIMKAYETKMINTDNAIRNAVLNALANFYRKKGKKFIPLWKKKQKRLDVNIAQTNMAIICEIENHDGKSWVEKIYKENGMRKQRKRGDKRGR